MYYLTDYLAILVNTPFRDLAQSADIVSVARKGVEITHGQDSETLDLLAKALRLEGKHEEAIATEKRALKLLPPASPDRTVMEPRRTLEKTLASMEESKVSK